MRMILALLCCASLAHADDRHAAVLLGVDAADATLVKSAHAIDGVIRARAGVEYRLAGDAKAIDAAVLAADCTTVQTSCAAKLGSQLGGDVVIAGKLERRGTHVELTLVLVDVVHKQRMRSVTQSGSDAKRLAKLAYDRLAGGEVGDLFIHANADHGNVLLDGQVVAGLFSGKTTITGIARGNHILAIRAKGYKPFRVDIAVEATTHQTLLLDPE